MKKSLLFLGTISSFLLMGCNGNGESVAPVAYTRFVSSGTQYVVYTTSMYPTANGHIQVWKDEAEAEREFASMDLMFTFDKILGPDEIDGTKYTLVDVANGKTNFTVDILKSSDIYDVDKRIYLNGEALTPTTTYGNEESEPLLILTFEDVSFIRTNSGGHIDNSKVNTLEYK